MSKDPLKDYHQIIIGSGLKAFSFVLTKVMTGEQVADLRKEFADVFKAQLELDGSMGYWIPQAISKPPEPKCTCSGGGDFYTFFGRRKLHCSGCGLRGSI